MRKQPVLYSFGIHLALVTLLLVTATFTHYTSNVLHSTTVLEVPTHHLTAPKIRAALEGGGSGGGNRNALPAQQGAVPRIPKVWIPLTPRPQESPRITVPVGLEDVPQIATDMPIGVPNGILGTNSLGSGTNGAGGPGNKGPGQGPGGGPGDKLGPRGYSQQRLSVLPKLLWKTEPEYSEEARKARHQGSVLLALEIDSEGRPRNIRVVQSLGLGLDERAIAAVSQWRFKPGLLNGRPVNAPIRVEVSFRLL